MKNIFKILGFVIFVVLSQCYAETELWKPIDKGLFVAEFDSPQKSEIGDSKITIVKINPKYYSFKLLCASETGEANMTCKQWCKKYGLIAGINAGMFREDKITNCGYMRNFKHINNPKLAKDYNAVLAFNTIVSTPTVPEVQIIDRTCQDFGKLKDKYHTLVQNIRMINCKQTNVWSQQNKKSSMAVMGMDKSGNILFIFTRSPYSGHDFNNVLLSLPISIYNAMYLEGGPEATLYLSSGDTEFEKVGSYETEFWDETNVRAWPIPNVIGIAKKPEN